MTPSAIPFRASCGGVTLAAGRDSFPVVGRLFLLAGIPFRVSCGGVTLSDGQDSF